MTSRPFAEVIGDPIAHSKSPLIHNFWLRKLGIDAEYGATRVTPDSLADYLQERLQDPNWRGSNVTMPLKISVLAQANWLSADAKAVGAANVVMPLSGGALGGFNGDVDGVSEPLRAMVNPADAVPYTVQILGSGGAAPAAAVGARRAGFRRFSCYVRDPSRADAFAKQVGAVGGAARSLDRLGPEDAAPHLLINATPMGMASRGEVPVHLGAYPEGSIVFDMVYDPLETALLRQARERGLRVIDGLQMLVGQAAVAFEHFFDAPAPREHDQELRTLLTE